MKKELQVIKTELNIGVENPFSILHMTDTHITIDDPGADSGRQGCFDCDFENSSQDYCLQAIEYAKQNNMTILNTGDLLDYLSEGNFEFVKKHFANVDYMYAAGNHDFCHFLGKAAEDYEYKWEMMKTTAPLFKNNLYFYSRMLGEVNMVTLDNSYYRITEGQLEALKAEVAKGHPIILGMHVPFFTESIAEYTKEINGKAHHVMDVPQEIVDAYPDNGVRVRQTPDEATKKAIEYIKSEPMIKALITGHKHHNFVDMLSPTLIQYVTTGTHYGEIREFTVV